MDEIVNLVIPFIALVILSVMIDKFTLFLEGVMNRVPRFPDRFEWWAAYLIVLIVGFLVCWQGDFSLFSYLEMRFRYDWEGWILTALVISGGSAFVRTQFSMIQEIPTNLFGISTTVKKFATSFSQKVTSTEVRDTSSMSSTVVESNTETTVNSDQMTETGYDSDRYDVLK